MYKRYWKFKKQTRICHTNKTGKTWNILQNTKMFKKMNNNI